MLKKCAIPLFALLLFCSLKSSAQETINPVIADYVRTYAALAIKEMQRTGVPAAIKLAQGILETEAGKSDLVLRSNNHFGIKCKSWWTGEKVYHDDDERGECFRKYPEAADSWRDHSDYLKSQPRYAFLFNLNPEDYEGWAKGLKKAGYATNPKYPQILIRYIETYHLYDYTLIAMGKKSPESSMLAMNVPAPVSPVIEEKNTTIVSTHPEDVAAKPVSLINATSSKKTVQKKTSYPEVEFTINDTRVVYANAGTSLLAIAEKYKVRLNWLYDFNEIEKNKELLEKNQLVYLQRKRRQSHNEFHITSSGESLEDISQEEGLRLESLLAYNYLQKGMIPAAGEKLYLKYDAPERPKLAFTEALHNDETEIVSVDDDRENTAAGEMIQRHTVQTKETLFSLSKKYQVSQDQIREWNKLSSGDLRVGQELLIYKSR